MKRKNRFIFLFLLLSLFFAFAGQGYAAEGDIPIDAEHFPDENFRNYLIKSENGGNAVFSKSKISEITLISCYNKDIADLTGIEYFTGLKVLYCSNNQLTKLDVSKNTALTELGCQNNNLTKLNVDNCVELTEINCSNNNLTELNFVNCVELTEINCTGNNLVSIDTSSSTKLNKLYCDDTVNSINCYEKDFPIDVVHFPDENFRKYIVDSLADGNHIFRVASGKDITKITSLYINGKKLTDLTGIEYFTGLKVLNCEQNRLTKLDVSNNATLTTLKCYDNRLTELNVANCSELTEIWCYDNNLSSIDTSSNTKLATLYCDDTVNPIKCYEKDIPIDAVHFPDENFRRYLLENQSGSYPNNNANNPVKNHIYHIGSKNDIKEITSLYIWDKDIVDLTGIEYFTALEDLRCSGNKLTKLDVSKNTALTRLECQGNLLTKLILGNNENLEYLDCRDNPDLVSINVGGCPYLTNDFYHDETLRIIEEEEVQPEFKYHSLMLDGQIGVNFYVYLPEIEGVDYSDGNTCYMEFDINGDKSNNPQPVDYNFCFSDSEGKTYYGFRAYIKSVQMADDITAIFHYGDNESVTHNYKAKDYLDAALARDDFSEAEKDLMIAIKDYGHYVQPMLSKNNNWVIGVDYAEMDCETIYDDNDVDETREAAKPYSIIRDPGNSGIERVSFNLALGSETTINLNLIVSSNYNGNVSAVFDGGTENIAVKQSNGTYKIQIANIPAHELGDNNVIKVTAGESFDVVVSALSYVDAILNIDSTDEERKAATALFKYYEAAMAYKRSIGR